LTPQNNESGRKKKTTHIGKSGAYLLIQVALAASSSEKHPEVKGKHQALKKARRKKATIAIARRLLTAIYHILRKNEAYDSSLYY
jgi:transposase